MIRLPLPFRRPRSALWYALPWAPYVALYQLTNRFPVVEPRELPMTALDTALPFVPELLPLYVAYIPLFWWTVARSRDDREAGLAFYATYFQMLLCLPLFVLMPVRMPRELFYDLSAHGWAGTFWQWFDAPNNCLPSLHTANCLLLVYLARERPEALATAALAAAIIASTVLVRQHYVVDLVAGAAVYVLTRIALGHVRIVDARRGCRPTSG